MDKQVEKSTWIAIMLCFFSIFFYWFYIHQSPNINGSMSEGRRRISVDISVEEIKKENARLKKEIGVIQEFVKEKEIKVGSESISIGDYQCLKGFFEIYDEDKDGYIDASNLISLHESLGEPVTVEEADLLVKELSESNKGKIDFNAFLIWWIKSHTGTKDNTNKKLEFKTHGAFVMNNNDFDLKNVSTETDGVKGELSYRMWFYYQKDTEKKKFSPWHDVPLYVLGEGKKAKILHFLCEIPKWTRVKYEVATKEMFNPIKQDVKNGKVRYYQHGDMLFNYGCFPQTWENPNHISKDTNQPGDNDPIDGIEIGTKQIKSGGIAQVKVLGVLGMIDDNETDWKVICISIDDPLSHLLNDVDDVEEYIPGAIDALRDWLRDYKVCTGKEPNTFAFNGKCKDKEYTLNVIEETHNFWKKLRQEKKDIIHTPLPTSQRKFENFWNSIDVDKEAQILFKSEK